MKKLITLVLLMIGLAGCSASSGNPFDKAFFIAKVIEIKETTMLVEITDKGNCGVSEKDLASVSTEKIAGVVANDSSIVTDNYVRIEFDGNIMETYPLRLGEIFKIDITDAEGTPVE